MDCRSDTLHDTLRREDCHEVAKFINQVVLRHGAPEVPIKVRGTDFPAKLVQGILRYSNTDHGRATAYHPQTNGRTDHLNKTIADMLSMYVDVEPKTCDEFLPYVRFAYNTAIQDTTQMSPFELVHGKRPTTMLA